MRNCGKLLDTGIEAVGVLIELEAPPRFLRRRVQEMECGCVVLRISDDDQILYKLQATDSAIMYEPRPVKLSEVDV